MPHDLISQALFESKVDKSNLEGCWEWTGNLSPRGYGRLTITLRAHRVAYILAVGPIPRGLTIDHLCFNPSCVNPSHLEAVTDAVNNSRKRTHTVCRNGHLRTAANTRLTKRGTRQCRACDRAGHARRKLNRHDAAGNWPSPRISTPYAAAR